MLWWRNVVAFAVSGCERITEIIRVSHAWGGVGGEGARVDWFDFADGTAIDRPWKALIAID